MFTTISICAVISDYALASLLGLLLKYGEFGITFEGMEYGLNLGDLFGQVESGKRSFASLKLEGESKWLGLKNLFELFPKKGTLFSIVNNTVMQVPKNEA
jgi:hypothetical protein